MAGGIAIRRLIRGEDGVVKVALVDLNTLQDVTDPTGYTILEPDNGVIEDIPLAQHPKTAQAVAGPDEIPPTAKTIADIRGGGRMDAGDAATGMKGPDRDSPNNFGYRDKPTGLGLASALPGPLGMAGKAVNAAINANNLIASNSARSYLGLPERSTFANVKGVVSDVGNVVSEKANIGGEDYQIGFGGVSEDGKTTQLTPDEARTRSMVMDAPIKEGSVSERGFGYRAPETPSAPESGTPQALGQDYAGTATGTKQGLAGSLGGVTATELGTVPDAATPDSMRSLPDISAPVSGSVTSSKGLMSQPTLGQQAPSPSRFGGSTPEAPTKVGDTIDVPDREEVSSPSVMEHSANMQSKAPASIAAQPGMKRTASNNFGYTATPADKPTRSSLASPQTAAVRDPTATTGYKASAITSPASAIGPTREQAVKDAYDAAYGAGLSGIQADMSVAQAMHESAWGQKPAGTSNLHGIKSKTGTSVPTREVDPRTGKSYRTTANFANFASPEESFSGWKSLMERNFPGVLTATTEEEAIDALEQGRLGAYATDFSNPDPAKNYRTHMRNYLKAVQPFSYEATGPAASKNLQGPTGVQRSVEDTYSAKPGGTTGLGQFTGQTKGSVKENALTGSLGLGGGYVSDVGVSGVSTKDTSMASNPSPGGETGFGRQSSLRDSISAEAKGGLGGAPDGPKGRESIGGGLKSSPSSLGGRVGSGGFSGGSTSTTSGSKGGRVGTGGFSGGVSDNPDGRKGQESYGGSSTSSSSSSSKSSGSASSASSGNSRGGMSSGRGMGGFN